MLSIQNIRWNTIVLTNAQTIRKKAFMPVVSIVEASFMKFPVSIWRGVVFVVFIVNIMAMGHIVWADLEECQHLENSCNIEVLGERILGVEAGIKVVGLYEKGSCKNILDDKEELITTSTHYYFEHHSLGYTGYNYMGRHDYFKENGINTGRLKGGMVEFANGTKGVIDAAFDGVGTRADGTVWNESAYIYYNAYDGMSLDGLEDYRACMTTSPNGVCILNYDTLPPQQIQVPRILNQLGTWEVPQPPEEPIWQGNGDAPSLENPWELEPVERFLSCYQVILKDGRPVTRENCYAMIDKRIWKHEEWAIVKDAYWFPWADKCSELRDAEIIGRGVATLATGIDLQIKLKENKNEAQLKLITSSEENTAELLILRGNRLKNGGTEIKVACQFNSGHSPYSCTDQPVADTYRVVEKEYSGRLIVYEEEVLK